MPNGPCLQSEVSGNEQCEIPWNGSANPTVSGRGCQGVAVLLNVDGVRSGCGGLPARFAEVRGTGRPLCQKQPRTAHGLCSTEHQPNLNPVVTHAALLTIVRSLIGRTSFTGRCGMQTTMHRPPRPAHVLYPERGSGYLTAEVSVRQACFWLSNIASRPIR